MVAIKPKLGTLFTLAVALVLLAGCTGGGSDSAGFFLDKKTVKRAVADSVADDWRSRSWSLPITVYSAGFYFEPLIAVDSAGVIYYAPNSYGLGPWRSTDGGRTFQEIPLEPTEALPSQRTDSSIYVAPDDSVWYSRSALNLGSAMGCTSTNKGDTWTCDSLAMPAMTAAPPNADRMWIAGLDSMRGYIYALYPQQGLRHTWVYTDDGSNKYYPHGTATERLSGSNGNLAYDEVHDTVWAIENYNGNLHLARVSDVTGPVGIITWTDTRLPRTMALPWITTNEGVLWTMSEPTEDDGSRSAQVARSEDEGRSWEVFPIATEARSVTFSYVAAGPGGRAAVVYYGSPNATAPQENVGPWSLYVSETDNADDDHPYWHETKLVDVIHEGIICVSAGCTAPYARFSGDNIGIEIDADGNTHIAYVDDHNPDHAIKNQYVRSSWG